MHQKFSLQPFSLKQQSEFKLGAVHKGRPQLGERFV